MPNSESNMARFWDRLGPDLYTACRQNNVADVKILASAGMDTSDLWEGLSNWSAAILTAASVHGREVAEFCLENARHHVGTLDSIGWCVLGNEELEPAYRFLVDSNLMDPETRIGQDRTIAWCCSR
jgi:hypothetical protein